MVDDVTIKRAAFELKTRGTTLFNIGDAEITIAIGSYNRGVVEVRVFNGPGDGPEDGIGNREYEFTAHVPTPDKFRFGCVTRAIDHWGDHTDIAYGHAPTLDVEFWSTVTRTVLAILVHRG